MSYSTGMVQQWASIEVAALIRFFFSDGHFHLLEANTDGTANAGPLSLTLPILLGNRRCNYSADGSGKRFSTSRFKLWSGTPTETQLLVLN